MSEYIGCMVEHREYKLGKIVEKNGRFFTIFFYLSGESKIMSLEGLDRGVIPPGTLCKTVEEECVIKKQIVTPDDEIYKYRVEYLSGLVGEVTEKELMPTVPPTLSSPVEVLTSLTHEGYPVFNAREALFLANQRMLNKGKGVASLLSSRIDLHPHQAFVAGTVLLDTHRRYLLADEVGLGKTIEAGIVVHDYLAKNPNANILIICPGALVQQWFTEMYAKFSGVVFSLPDLKDSGTWTEGCSKQMIASFYSVEKNQVPICNHAWDLIVVDEVHHLLRQKSLYRLVQALSFQESALLLLSALPAQHREQEYYDLLSLLEPSKYDYKSSSSRSRFCTLYEMQREIGGRIGIIKRRIREIEDGVSGQEEKVVKQIGKLLELNVFIKDKYLLNKVSDLSSTCVSFSNDALHIVQYVSDYYRINRRILRNRREILVSKEQLPEIHRQVNEVSYRPDQYEIEAVSALGIMLTELRENGVDDNSVVPLAAQLYQATVHPISLLETLRRIEKVRSSVVIESEQDEWLYDLASYDERQEQLDQLWCKVADHISDETMRHVVQLAEEWETQGSRENHRLHELISLLKNKHSSSPEHKYILFAGYPQLAKILIEQLGQFFDQRVIATFYQGMETDPIAERERKEKEIDRFRRSGDVWLLVCDETGGEGRNFQFVDEIVHYDLPLQVAKIEQRIGRLDRLGREKPEVMSNVITRFGSIEVAWFQCLSKGLDIFSRSISGLEFALRDIEHDFVQAILDGDEGQLWDFSDGIRQRVVEERYVDDSQNQIDEASYERVRADEFRRLQSSHEQDCSYQERFIQYFKMISSARSFKCLSSDHESCGVIEFYPEDVLRGKLNLSDQAKARRGTFVRELAQQRPDLEFFSVGNKFHDAVISAVRNNVVGRCYAVECYDSQTSVWLGFEFVYRLTPSQFVDESYAAYKNTLDYIFSEKPMSVFVGEKGDILSDSQEILQIRRSLEKSNKGARWRNITKSNARLLSQRYDSWDNMVREYEKVAKGYARKLYEEVLTPIVDEHRRILFEESSKIMQGKSDFWEEKVEAISKLQIAIENWDIELDSLGFLSLNGGILNG